LFHQAIGVVDHERAVNLGVNHVDVPKEASHVDVIDQSSSNAGRRAGIPLEIDGYTRNIIVEWKVDHSM
jgi:hypothetical protein